MTKPIDVQVPGLAGLPSGTHYERGVGSSKTRHHDYFRGRPELIEAMQAVADDFWNAFPEFDPIIRFNDMSLEKGGNFRTNGAEHPGECDTEDHAHIEHKFGLNVDGSRNVSLLLRDQNGVVTRTLITLDRFGSDTWITTYREDGSKVQRTHRVIWTALDNAYSRHSNGRFFSSGSPWESPRSNPDGGDHWHLRVNWRQP